MKTLNQMNVAVLEVAAGRPSTSQEKPYTEGGCGQGTSRDSKGKKSFDWAEAIAWALQADEKEKEAKKTKGLYPADCNGKIGLPEDVAHQVYDKGLPASAAVPSDLDVPLGDAARARNKKEGLSPELYIRNKEALRHIELLGLKP